MTRPDLHAVATGDVVESSQLSREQREALPDLLDETYATLSERVPDAWVHHFAIAGGDGWQFYMDRPVPSLATVLQLWTLLYSRGIPTRITLAVDTIDFISDGDPNKSDGAAFRRSGRGLENLRGEQLVDILFPEETPAAHRLAVETIGDLVDQLAHDWTEAQARAIADKLRGTCTGENVTQQMIAEEWEPEPITKQAVGRHLQRANWPRLEPTLDRFERLVDDLLDTLP